MSMLDVAEGRLPGVYLIKPKAFEDRRGFFTETYHNGKYGAAGIDGSFVQDNFSFSRKHVLRGLHFQRQYPQGKLVYVVQGEVFDVAVDIRPGSPTFGQWEAYVLSGDNHHQLYVPEGFAHGFVVLSEAAAVMYKCTGVYRPDDDRGILWNDVDLDIDWPIKEPILSEKDAELPCLKALSENELPVVGKMNAGP